MPPKKKPGSAGSGKKKSGGKKSTSGEKGENASLELETSEKLTKSNIEVGILTKELDLKEDIITRLKQHLEEQRAENARLEYQLDQRAQERVELTSDMSRQFKTMQAEMATRIVSLEAENNELKVKLASTQQALENSNKTSDQKIAEKDLIIEDQTVKMSYMSTEFEQMLNDTLSKMTKKLETVSLKWKETEGVKMSDSSQKKLADFQIMRNLMTTS